MCVALCVLFTPHSTPASCSVPVHWHTLRYPSSALQIFQKESHPSSYKLGSGAKEGLSLFGELSAPVCGHMHTVSWCMVGLQEESLLTGWRLDSPPTVYWVSLGVCCALVEDRTGRSAVTCSVCVVFCVCCVMTPLEPVEGYDPGLLAVQTHMLEHCTVHGAVSGSPPGHTVHNPS